MDNLPQYDHEVDYRLEGSLTGPDSRDSDRLGDIIVSSWPASVGLELLLGPPKRRGTRRGGDGESTRSRPRSIRPRPRRGQHQRLAPCGRSGDLLIISNSYEVLRRLTILRKMA
jgi:hypothetical protein